jgi:hypothetical protein
MVVVTGGSFVLSAGLQHSVRLRFRTDVACPEQACWQIDSRRTDEIKKADKPRTPKKEKKKSSKREKEEDNDFGNRSILRCFQNT